MEELAFSQGRQRADSPFEPGHSPNHSRIRWFILEKRRPVPFVDFLSASRHQIWWRIFDVTEPVEIYDSAAQWKRRANE